MLTKRKFVTNFAASSIVIPIGAVSIGQTSEVNLNGNISNVQRQLSLETTIGSLIGAALGSLIYQFYAKSAPVELVAAFVSAIVDQAGSANLRSAAGAYVESTASQVAYNVQQSRNIIQRDTSSDVIAYNQLTAVVQSQTSGLITVQNDLSASVRDLREQLAEVRKEIEVVRLERSRAFSSNAVYGSVEQETRRSGLDKSGELENVIGEAKVGANNLNKHCEALEDQILRM